MIKSTLGCLESTSFDVFDRKVSPADKKEKSDKQRTPPQSSFFIIRRCNIEGRTMAVQPSSLPPTLFSDHLLVRGGLHCGNNTPFTS